MATKPQTGNESGRPARKPTRAQIKKRLSDEHRALSASLGDGRSLTSPPEMHDQHAEEALDDVATEAEFGRRESLHERVQLVEAALEQLESGTYGLCRLCGNPIEPRRLEADAATANCFDCQSSSERLHKRATM
jgi:RNA polymerase-binding transcription factor DksA